MKRTHWLGGGPHWKECSQLRRQLGAQSVIVLVVDEHGTLHGTAQTEPVGLSILAKSATRELARLVKDLVDNCHNPVAWSAEMKSSAREARPPVGPDGPYPDTYDDLPPHLVAGTILKWLEESKRKR